MTVAVSLPLLQGMVVRAVECFAINTPSQSKPRMYSARQIQIQVKHKYNYVPRIEKSPYLAQTLRNTYTRNKLENCLFAVHKIHTLSGRTTYNGSEDTMHRFKNKDYKRAHKDLNCNFKQCSSPGLSRNEQPYDCC